MSWKQDEMDANAQEEFSMRNFMRGNRIYYRIASGHPAFDDLQRVFVKTVAVADVLREVLEPLRGSIDVAFIYGSMADGSELATSDIDVFVVGDAPVRSVVAGLSDAEAHYAEAWATNIWRDTLS